MGMCCSLDGLGRIQTDATNETEQPQILRTSLRMTRLVGDTLYVGLGRNPRLKIETWVTRRVPG